MLKLFLLIKNNKIPGKENQNNSISKEKKKNREEDVSLAEVKYTA